MTKHDQHPAVSRPPSERPPSERPPLARAIRRAKWRIVPLLLLMYMMGYLDRANVGYAKAAYQHATGLSESAFALGAGIFFIAYAVFEVPSNLMMHRVGARRWLARIMITWGLISACMIFAKTELSFSVVRLLLGAAEAGLFPGAILYITQWFPAQSRVRILALFYFGAPIALMLGGPTSGMLLQSGLGLGLQGWQSMFLVEGLGASCVGVILLLLLVDRPEDAHFLSTVERAALVETLAREDLEKRQHGAADYRALLRRPRILHYAMIYFLIQIPGYGLAFYLPTQVSALLHMKVGLLVGLVTSIPWACAIIAGLIWPGLAIQTGRRKSFATISLLCIAIGLTLSANLPPAWAIAALCLVTMGIITAQPIFWTFPTEEYAGPAAAAGFAIINATGNLGGFFAPTMKVALEARVPIHGIGLYGFAAAALLAAILLGFIREVARPGTASADLPIIRSRRNMAHIHES